MRLSLRPGERVYINGAVLRVDRKVGIELMNDATFLLESHVLQAEAATTPLRQLYFAAQALLIDPAQGATARAVYAGIEAGLLSVTRDRDILSGLLAARALMDEDRVFEALKLIRGLYPAEAALLAAASEGEDAAGTPLRPAGPAPATALNPSAPSPRPAVAANPEV